MARERTNNRREFLMLAHKFDRAKHHICGWFASEKLDGMRAFWDGGITRGLYCHEVPFANIAKDGIRVNPPKATGLWSRYGKPIQAPMWFLDELPKYPLDGELSMGRGTFQALMSACRRLTPDDDTWAKVSYHVFDLPDYSQVFRDGTINVPNFEKEIKGMFQWLHMQKICKWKLEDAKRRRFETVVFLLNQAHPSDGEGIVKALHQTQLPFTTEKAMGIIDSRLTEIVSRGGEGLILRHYGSVWEPQRSYDLLKVKPYEDAETRVTGYTWGKATDRGSKLLGLMGNLVTEFNGKRLEVSGFTDAERILVCDDNEFSGEGVLCAGQPVSRHWTNPNFPIGSQVTIRYRELTTDGIPKECRFLRSRPDE